jgi:predicted transposase/invertase (TIGR01784 family)
MAHDQTFKDILQAFFPDFLALFLPAIASAIDPADITFLHAETFTDVPAGLRRTPDVVAQVHAMHGLPELVLVHTEVQTEDEPDFAYRMWEYNALVTLRKRLPAISVALLPFASSGGVTLTRYSETLFGQEYAKLDYWRIPLQALVAEEYLAADTPLGTALAALMRPRSGDRVDLRLAVLERLARGDIDEARQYLLVNLVETYLELNDAEQARYKQRLTTERRSAVETLELTWGERKVQEGREQGLAEGLLQARRTAVLDVLRMRFGDVPETLALRVTQSHDEELTRLLRQAVQVEHIEDMTG